MNAHEHVLTCTAEEAAEIAAEFLSLSKICHKSLRFGLADVNVLHQDGPDNATRLVAELNDLMGVIELLEERGILPPDWKSRVAIDAKKAKVKKFMSHAQDTGALHQTVEFND